MSGSVMMVAGLELTRTTSYPSSRKALHALLEQHAAEIAPLGQWDEWEWENYTASIERVLLVC